MHLLTSADLFKGAPVEPIPVASISRADQIDQLRPTLGEGPEHRGQVHDLPQDVSACAQSTEDAD